MSNAIATESVGIVGARGYVGAELLALVLAHPRLSLAFATSSSAIGAPIAGVVPDAPTDLHFENVEPEELADRAPEVLVLALANGASEPCVQAAMRAPTPPRVILDISADHRFEDAWTYGLSEHFESEIRDARLIANPGCYATALQLAVRPLLPFLSAVPNCFGVSGYSGAGAAPSDRNNPDLLHDNIMPYSLVGHTHERECARHLGARVRFAPSVAPFFRGIMMTALCELSEPIGMDALDALYTNAYADAPLIDLLGETVPSLHDVINTNRAHIGRLTVDADDPRKVAVVCAIDNLRKGAASQAVQNINLALGFDTAEGLQ